MNTVAFYYAIFGILLLKKAKMLTIFLEIWSDWMDLIQNATQLIPTDNILAFFQVGYSRKMANVWTKVAEEAAGSSNRSSEASSSGFSTPS